MKKIKLFALCLAVACLLTVFVGCGGSDDVSSKASSSAAASSEVSSSSSDDAASIDYDPTASMESVSSTASIDEIVEVID